MSQGRFGALNTWSGIQGHSLENALNTSPFPPLELSPLLCSTYFQTLLSASGLSVLLSSSVSSAEAPQGNSHMLIPDNEALQGDLLFYNMEM